MLIRARFRISVADPRPIHWPIKHPYWITGYGDDYALLIAYADDEDEILSNWPEATEIDSEECDKYHFSSRFPKPEWFTGDSRGNGPATEV